MGKTITDNRTYDMIQLLKNEVEIKWSKTMNSLKDYEDAAVWINEGEKHKDNQISGSSLMNMWSGSELKYLHYKSKLSIIARKIGFNDWDDFCEKSIPKYDMTKGFKTINMYEFNNLIINQDVCIGWFPHKYCMLKYLGDFSFKIVESYNLMSPVNRIFETTGFIHRTIKSKIVYPDIIIEPILDDDPDWELIKMDTIPEKYLL